MVFITASPLLARTVSKLYHRIINYLKFTLKEKEQRAAQGLGTSSKPSSSTTSPEHKKEVPVVSELIEPAEPSLKETKSRAEVDEFEIIGDESQSPTSQQDSTQPNATEQESIKMVEDFMSDFDLKILEEAEKEVEEMMQDLNLDSDKSEIPNTFMNIDHKDFPLFLTLKEFLYLMDSVMPESFFARNLDNIIRSGIRRGDGRKGFFRRRLNEAGNRLFDNILFRDVQTGGLDQAEVSEDEDDIPIELSKATENQPEDDKLYIQDKDKDLADGTEVVTEVDFDDFKDLFFPYFLEQQKGQRHLFRKVSPIQAWQKIRNLDVSGSDQKNDTFN